MPELPEVYCIVDGLNKKIIGNKIIDTKVFNSKIVNGKSNFRVFNDEVKDNFIINTTGKTIKKVKRKGKIIIIDFIENGGLIIHLKMTGQLIFDTIENIDRHSHVVFVFEEGYLIYNDVRKFGYVNYFDSQEELENCIKHLPIDPINDNFTFKEFKKIVKYKSEVKKIFLDQKIVLGIGNIYSDEICFDAGILPTRKCNELSNNEIKRLYESILKILNQSIKYGGSSISDYRLTDGTRGSFQTHHKVYGRAGKKCYICSNTLQKTKISGRATVYCENCQN